MSEFAFPPATVPADSTEAVALARSTAVDCLRQAESASTHGRHAEARALFHAALDADRSPETVVRFARFLADLGELTEAKSQLQRLLNEQTSPGLRSVVCHNLAALERESGDPLAARFRQQAAVAATLSAAVEIPGDTSPAAVDARDLIALAADHLATDDLATATRLLDAARRSARAAGDLESLGDVWGMRGVVSIHERRFRRAVRDLHTAARLHRAARDRHGLGIDLLNLAETYRALGRLDDAKRFADRAARSFQAAGAVSLQKRAVRLAADVARILAVRSGEPSWN